MLFFQKFRRKLVRSVEINGEEIFVKLKNGLRFYGPREVEKSKSPYLEYAAWKLGIDASEDFFSFICVLMEIFHFNIYEKFYKIKKKDVVVDAGAFVGMFAAKAAKAVGRKGKVIAIEPEKENLEFLKRNIEENRLENIVVIGKGLWYEKGKKRLYLGYSSSASLVYPASRWMEVEVDTLDNLISELNLNVDFIKMDVEGAELEVLKGAEKVLGGNLNIVIGAYHKLNGEQTYKKIVPFLEARNFTVRRSGGIVYASKS
jgi:FkbM family methyltransferase